MTEFTGERVIPGQVDDDLWAEHLARYAFAARFAAGRRVLDVGCGTGYGTAELAKTALEAMGVDVAAEAVAYATEHYPCATFSTAGAEKLPYEEASFDLITAFELIEHLDDWRAMLREARRVLAPAGVLIVSTPNKLYYAEARGAAGPNPFHRHEFEYAEFRSALEEFFPQVRVLFQDRMESFGFYEPSGAENADASIVRSPGAAEAANFFVAVCSGQPLPEEAGFVYVPSAANLLREREAHISKLTGELAHVRGWLEATTAERDRMLAQHARMEEHLKEKNRWGEELDASLKAAQARIVELQEQFAEEQARARENFTRMEATIAAEQAGARKAIARMEATLSAEQASAQEAIARMEATLAAEQASAQEAITRLEATLAGEQTSAREAITRLEATLADEQARAMQAITLLEATLADEQARAMQAIARLEAALGDEQARAMQAITRLESTVAERTKWAQDLARQVQSLTEQVQSLSGELKALTDRAAELTGTLALVRQSRWVKAGRMVRLGPKL